MITESQLEQLALSWFQEIGWAHASGRVIAPDGAARSAAEAGLGGVRPERTSLNEVLVRGHMHAALVPLNPLPPAECR